MTQPADTQPKTMEQILEILRNQAIAIPNPITSARYLRALDSLASSVFRFPSSDKECATGLSQDDSDNGQRKTENTLPAGLSQGDSDNALQLRCTDWLVSLWLTDTPFSTASLYLDIISSLYGSAAKADLLPPTKLFSQLKTDLKALGPEGWKRGIDDEIFNRALRLTKNSAHLLADDHTAAQLVIYSLTHNLLPLTQVALLKKTDIVNGRAVFNRPVPSNGNLTSADSLSSGVSENGKRKTENARKARYWLPLRQSQRTPKQLNQHISKIVNALFRRARLPQATDPYQTVEALWAYAALRSGIPASTIIRHLGHAPLGLPVLKLSVVRCPLSEYGAQASQPAKEEPSEGSDIVNGREVSNLHEPTRHASAPDTPYCEADTAQSADTYKEYFSQVGKIFLENPPRWYAMALRPGVRFTQLCRRIELLNDSPFRGPGASGLELFYPCEEIARAIGKKIVTRQRPFIHSVVFFRAKLTDIGRLFSKIGDLAWCYRQSARPGAPYADISDRQFQLFQQTIAHFTPDYEVAASGDLELREGDRVEILGGLFAGQQATVMEPRLPSRPKDSAEAAAVGNCADCLSSGVTENGKRKTENAASGIIYRLNIIGDNGIDWRITVDPRLLKAP